MKKLGILLCGLFLAQTVFAADSIYGFKVKNIDGKEVNLADYKGKSVVIVNTASKCGYTPQYEALEALYAKYKDKGVVVLGFPSNDFGGQEPGTNAEIKHFCQANYHVDFPMFEKGQVKGEQKQPLFAFLTDTAPTKGEIRWNFEKFVVGPDGKVAARFRSGTKPDDKELAAAIEKTLTTK
ncbi:MAG: glutathione peroxidase [Bdellovibrionales bacterium]